MTTVIILNTCCIHAIYCEVTLFFFIYCEKTPPFSRVLSGFLIPEDGMPPRVRQDIDTSAEHYDAGHL